MFYIKLELRNCHQITLPISLSQFCTFVSFFFSFLIVHCPLLQGKEELMGCSLFEVTQGIFGNCFFFLYFNFNQSNMFLILKIHDFFFLSILKTSFRKQKTKIITKHNFFFYKIFFMIIYIWAKAHVRKTHPLSADHNGTYFVAVP